MRMVPVGEKEESNKTWKNQMTAIGMEAAGWPERKENEK